jgi:hypothetical protein
LVVLVLVHLMPPPKVVVVEILLSVLLPLQRVEEVAVLILREQELG